MNAALLLALAAAATSTGAPHLVDVYDWLFEDAGTGAPVTLAASGDTILWRVTGGMHSVRADLGAFASQPMLEGETFTTTVSDEGAITYYCEIHEWMRALIVVAS